MKVSELTGPALAEWVARAQGFPIERDSAGLVCTLPFAPWVASFGEHGYRPDLNWTHGGPLLDKFQVCIGRGQSVEYPVHRDIDDTPIPGVRIELKYATARVLDTEAKYQGDTTLIAGMRAIVASVYGSEVPDHPPQEE